MFLNLEFKDGLKIIDTHCHLDSEVFKEDLDELLKHSFDNGIEKSSYQVQILKIYLMQQNLLANMKMYFLPQVCILMS